MKLAVWSGPRNLSTAMMYCFAHHPDFTVVDEPFYAAYLNQTGLDHPLRDEILESQPIDPKVVASALVSRTPKPHHYQKHMTHHMIDSVPREWMADVDHLFLIRHPARVLASYSVKRENPTLHDIGFSQQLELFNAVSALGKNPVVVDASDIRAQPEKMIKAICRAFQIQFLPDMLSWPAGPKPFDGVWAKHWYNAVHASTGFGEAEKPVPASDDFDQEILRAAIEIYDTLAARKLAV